MSSICKLMSAWILALVGSLVLPMVSIAAVSGTTYDTPSATTTAPTTVAEHTTAGEMLDHGEIRLRSIASGRARSLLGFCRFLDAPKTTKVTKVRPTPGRDGATSRHIIEKMDDSVNSVTHQVTKDGKIIHQHQTHAGKHGTQRRFPDEWIEYPTVPAE